VRGRTTSSLGREKLSVATNHASYFPVFFVAWIALGLGVSFWMARIHNPSRKRSVHRCVTIMGGLLFLTSVWFFLGSARGMAFPVLSVIFITVLNLKLVRVCSNCAAFVYPRFFIPPAFCSKCGARLKAGDSPELPDH
jgi:hypothetical protein